MAKDLADLVVTLELQSAKYQQGFEQATKSLQKFQKDTTDGLSSIANAFAGALSIGALIDFGKSTIEASASLDNFSKSAGVSVEALSALQFAAKAGGVGTDELNSSLKKLNVSISEAAGDSTNKAALAFGLLGVNVKNANGTLKDADTVFNEIADKFASTADGANKVQLAVALFGKAGEALIPTLDKGSAGLKELADQAAAAGAIIDGPTAAAADAFNSKLLLLKTTLVDGVGAQVEKQLLPVLNALGDEFLGTSKNAEELSETADELAAGFKLLISFGVTIKDSFQTAGKAVGGTVAAIVAALHGDFKGALGIYTEALGDVVNNAKKTVTDVANVWKDGSKDILAPIVVTATKIKETLGSLSGAEAAQAALKTLTDFANQLTAEASKLDQGTVAATKYKLAHGDLAKALALTGAAGQKLANDAVAAATKIETVEITKQLEGLQSQLKNLSGDTVGAGLDAFAKSVDTLEKQLKDVGGATQANGQATIDALKQATVYQLEFNKAQTDASRIQQDAAAAEQAVTDAVANGSKTSIQGEQDLQAIRANTIAQLQSIADGENAIAKAANNPALTQGAKQFGASLDHLKAQTDATTTAIRGDLESAFADNFQKLITGAESFTQAFKGFAQSILADLTKIASKNIAESIFGTGGPAGGAAGGLASIFGAGAGSSGGGLGSLFSSIGSKLGFGGGGVAAPTGSFVSNGAGVGEDAFSTLAGLGFADGGTIPAGRFSLVGEKGPELAMAGSRDMQIIPGGTSRNSGPTITNHFVIQSQNGQISRPSQMQTAAAVARSVGAASARNNR